VRRLLDFLVERFSHASEILLREAAARPDPATRRKRGLG
jgi:hypothetical protein